MTKNPFVFTICDSGSHRVNALRSSLNNNLFLLETYSRDLGNLSKIFEVRKFLRSTKDLHDDSIIIFVDAYDVLCIRDDLTGLVAEFRATGQDLIIGAETIFCHHRSATLPYFLDNYIEHSARYPNSGFIMSYKWAYLRMLDSIADNFEPEYSMRHKCSDQRAISTFMVKNAGLNLIKMDLDFAQRFCHTHTYHDNPLRLDAINSYFCHVTWLSLEIQAKAYRAIAKRFRPDLVFLTSSTEPRD